MNITIKRLLIGLCAVALAAALPAGGTYAAPVTPDDSWVAAVDWDDTKEDETEPTTGTTAGTTAIAPPGKEQVVVSGKKTWHHGDNPMAKRPDSITIIVKADGAVVLQRLVAASDHWAWSFRLPKYSGGKEIAYTVNEARFEDYVKMVDGYNLTNIYMPGHNTDEPYPPGSGLPHGGSAPRTEDDSRPGLWLALMGGSLLGLAWLIMIRRGKRREENRS
ncbi:MAG: Cna B-type domain-containing protein [Firmicutes bacterium]|nr:Cna B-type domain-containing protein [Bacillota bacterium]